MKVLVAHNFYRSSQPSGENAAVTEDIEELSRVGVDVISFLRSSDSISGSSIVAKAEAAVGPVVNLSGVREFARVLSAGCPDIVHLHNPVPLISPWIVRVAKSAGVPVVQTVHNYRHGCVAGTYFRDGAVCLDCSKHTTGWPALVHGCYRGSRLQSLPMVAGQNVHRSTWRMVDRFFALTPFMRDRLEGLGLDRSRIELKPTTVPDPGPPPRLGPNVAFIGRLEPSKGIFQLLEAWRRARIGSPARLRVVGDGPSMPEVLEAARSIDSVDVLGARGRSEVRAEIEQARLIAVPSLTFEGAPKAVVEALSLGRPVLAADHGSLPSMLTEDAAFLTSTAPVHMAAALESAWALDDAGWAARSRAARQLYDERHIPSAGAAVLLKAYEELAKAPPRTSTTGMTK